MQLMGLKHIVEVACGSAFNLVKSIFKIIVSICS
jgi:hypothetical protein